MMTALFEPVHNRKNIDIRHSKANVQNDPGEHIGCNESWNVEANRLFRKNDV